MKKFVYALIGVTILLSLLRAEDVALPVASAPPTAAATASQPIAPKSPETVIALPLPQDKARIVEPTARPAPATPTPARFTKIAPTPAISNPPSRPMFVTGSRVNLRDGPSISAQIRGQLLKGQQVTLLDQTSGWARILPRPNSTESVWISAQYLAATPPAAVPVAKPAPKRTVTAPSSQDVTRAKQDIIAQSRQAYQGSCPCPYNRDRAGRRCGKRSAWSRPGGASPMCYESDVNQARLTSYFARKRGAVN